MKIFFKGFNYAQDGPGNRLVYHLQGCNMHCPWCANPEGMSFVDGTEYSSEQIVRECIRSRAMFFSGGGVTFTGGEATMQWEALIDVLEQLREREIHTALETNGTSVHLPEIQKHVDYLMMDFKHYDKEAFRKFTGVKMDALIQNFEYLCSIGRQLHIRIPLINHINTEAPEKFAAYFSRFDTSHVVFEFLPYHEYGREKWKTEYQITDGFINAEQLSRFQAIFALYRLKTIHT